MKSGKYLERWGEVILEKPKLDRCFGMPKDREHHYSEIETETIERWVSGPGLKGT